MGEGGEGRQGRRATGRGGGGHPVQEVELVGGVGGDQLLLWYCPVQGVQGQPPRVRPFSVRVTQRHRLCGSGTGVSGTVRARRRAARRGADLGDLALDLEGLRVVDQPPVRLPQQQPHLTVNLDQALPEVLVFLPGSSTDEPLGGRRCHAKPP
jgi:hypothetical protein